MATSKANEKLATSVWFIGVNSGMGRKRVVKWRNRRVGNAMPWAAVDYCAKNVKIQFPMDVPEPLYLDLAP